MVNIKDLSAAAAKDAVQAIAIANQQGIITSEAELTDLLQAVIESAIEEYAVELQKLKTNNNEVSSIRENSKPSTEPNY